MSSLERDCTDCDGNGETARIGTNLKRKCTYCEQGKIPSDFGREILDLIQKFNFPRLKSVENDLVNLDKKIYRGQQGCD